MPSSPPSGTPFGASGLPHSIDSPDMRRAGRELLSLALIDARNHTLHLLSLYEQALGSAALAVPRAGEVEPPVWLAGHIGWFAEWWIARNTQRAFGAECPVRPTRLAAIEPEADAWWNPAQIAMATRWSLELPDLDPDQGLPARHAGEHARTARACGRDRCRPLLLPARAVPRRPARRATGGDGADARPAVRHRAAAGRGRRRASRC